MPVLAAMAGVLVTAVACSGGTSSGSTATGNGVLTIGLSTGPVSLDPAKDSFTFQTVRALTNAAITHVAPNGVVGPGLATSYHYVGRGNTEFEFTLRHDARFSDGTPVTAAAVKTWLGYFAQGTGAAVSYLKIRSIDTVGQWTVDLHLGAPNALVPTLLSELWNWGAVSCPTSVAHPQTLGTQTCGAGPYVLDPAQTVANNKYTFVPNKYYYDKSAVKWSKIVANIIPTPTSRLEAVKTGQVQVAVGDVATASAASGSGLAVSSIGDVNTQGILIADRKGTIAKPLADVRVRQALNYAIDRKAITTALVGKYGTATSQMASVDGSDPKYQSYYPYDTAKARQLLTAAGYPHGGITLNVLWLNSASVPGTGDLVQAMAKYLSDVGVQLNVVQAANAGDYVAKQKSASTPLMLLVGGTGNMAQQYSLDFNPASPVNPFRVDDPVLDKLYAQANTAVDAGPDWKKLSQRITEQAYAIPVYNTSALVFAQKSVGGISGPDSLVSEWYPQ